MRQDSATWNTISHLEDGGITFLRKFAEKNYTRRRKPQITIVATIPAVEGVERYSNSVHVHAQIALGE